MGKWRGKSKVKRLGNFSFLSVYYMTMNNKNIMETVRRMS